MALQHWIYWEIASQPFLEKEISLALFFLAAIVAVSLLSFSKGRTWFDALALHPYSVVHRGKWYMLLTSGFLHADLNHLFFNVFSYFFFASALEQIVGAEAFAVIFLGSVVLSDIPSVLKYKDDPAYRSLGASGGVSGVIFSYILYDPLSKIYLFLIPIGIPAAVFAVLYLAYSFYASERGMDNINHSAHFWGAMVGVLLTVVQNPSVLQIFWSQLWY
ncbi:Rhomboid family protein [Chloroherpeton thalassium ATCC 35110]|uniref:Rhomboid family protein n=1 Tax=Chloroherpeton thalassium (strain ATCC 35110 / GB-78) TaxID=517418 RepID=B3QXF9_CHLT3|nr:rhomboid family intramembrane serine protease [Chloroherpeton thalassium]ACF13433.1 Rhomboid family protein [Chloroherpeton thalassium ATCC 35110]